MKLRLFAFIAVITLFSGTVFAQATRTWVSGVGDDVNPCSRTAPCKTWAGAISKTFIGGEINAIDSGGFGALTITKSITIDGAGVHASTLGSGTNGINISIAISANDPQRRVVLRNLSINGTGSLGSVGTNTGLNGVNINTNGAASVIIDRVSIQNFNNGVVISASANQTNLFMTNVEVTNCSTNGIVSAPTGTGTARLDLSNVRVVKTGTTTAHDGILIGVNSNTHLKDVTVAGSAGNGFRVNGGSAVTIDRSTFQHNGGAGVLLDNAGALLVIGNSASTQNAAGGYRTNAGLMLSYKNNLSSNNAIADSVPTQQGFY